MPSLKDLPDDMKNAAIDWLESLPNHPEYGREFKKLLKKVDSRIQYPDMESEERIETKLAAHKKEFDDYISNQNAEKNKNYWEGKRKAARDKYSFTDEDIQKVEKFMVDEHVGNYELAAKHYNETTKAPAEPTNYYESRAMQLPNSPGLFQDETRWARNEAAKAISEIERKRNG